MANQSDNLPFFVILTFKLIINQTYGMKKFCVQKNICW